MNSLQQLDTITRRIAKQLDNIASEDPVEAYMIASAYSHLLALMVGNLAPDRIELAEVITLFTEGFAKTSQAAFETKS